MLRYCSLFSKGINAGVFLLTAALFGSSAWAVPEFYKQVNIESSDFTPGMHRVLSGDSSYFLWGEVVVPATCTLEIKPGTTVYGNGSWFDIEQRSVLIIAPKAVLLAEGTIDSPIVFTYYLDDPRDPDDYGPGAKGLWGGIVWCGEAPTSRPDLWYPEVFRLICPVSTMAATGRTTTVEK